MQKLKLHHTMLQGEFSKQELNFLFVFQVNCPGCFLYGIPLFNKLYYEFKDDVGFLGLSTAFEDFSFNTIENTNLLLDRSQIFGETRKALQSTIYDLSLDFPVAMDQLLNEATDLEAAANNICELNPNIYYWPVAHKRALKEKVLKYLKQQEKISLTFTLNQLRGTPTFIVFDKNMNVLEHLFGYQSVETLRTSLQQNLLYSKDH